MRSGEQRKPKEVEALSGVRCVQAAIGGWHCLALDDTGQARLACMVIAQMVALRSQTWSWHLSLKQNNT